ncbi:hypothetical protein PoB_003872600 [Plakobranchus ocellatus]|uniref:PGG domain-containing protein n=1 Tax=Plakobranchus ocellatus TaxID=259542 RepID=A0AAV4AM32_9GAST|nr:hypothetical protein PoB_003872600 [Plakobranchus ocellatus]
MVNIVKEISSFFGPVVELADSSNLVDSEEETLKGCGNKETTHSSIAMTFHFTLTGLTVAAVYASLVHQTEAGWQDRFNVNDVIKKNSGVQKPLDGSLGFIINTIVDIVLLLLSVKVFTSLIL